MKKHLKNITKTFCFILLTFAFTSVLLFFICENYIVPFLPPSFKQSFFYQLLQLEDNWIADDFWSVKSETSSENTTVPETTNNPQDAYISPPVFGYNEEVAQGLYNFTLHTHLGDLVYYTQEDKRWVNAFYGDDPLVTHGCGPALLAILVASFVDPDQTPVTMAQWSYDQGYYSQSDGSYHSIISQGLKDFGFQVKSFPGQTAESIYGALDSDRYLVALMGEGNFTANGHFILLTGVTPDGLIQIADPKSFYHTQQAWDVELLLSQLKTSASSGGPLWLVTPPGFY